MNKQTLFILFTTCCFPMAASGQSLLLGKWVFHSSNHAVPEKCTRSYLDFVSPSRIKGSDGSRSVEIAYTAERIDAGYNLITERLGDDGKPDCHGNMKGEPASTNEKLGFFFVSLSEDREYMQFYFSRDRYFTYKKEK